jgi:hypothetical protein
LIPVKIGTKRQAGALNRPHLRIVPPFFSTLRLLVAENTPETMRACVFAMVLSASEATAPSSVTFPLLTMM